MLPVHPRERYRWTIASTGDQMPTKTIAGQKTNIPRKPWWSKLQAIGACVDAVEWCKTQPNLKAAWTKCERGDWMLWLIGRTSKSEAWSEERKPLVMLACQIARTALKYVKPDEDRPRLCIETTEAWCRGEATTEQVLKARSAAYAAYAAYAASASAAAAAAAAASAADAAAAYAADPCAYAAASAAAARIESYKNSADIVRAHFPKAPVIKR